MRGENIAQRLRQFAAAVIRLSRSLPHDGTTTHVARQLVRSATAAGANYEEARSGESRADFIHKVCIANKELREALYWLHLAMDAELTSSASELMAEANELISILTASINTAKQRRLQDAQGS